jgi:NAD-dependent SIR2 family protein deacetylase
MQDDFEHALRRAVSLIRDADALIVAAGAGMGVDSGLPDFRGREGFWQAYPALGQRGISFTEAANPETFQTDAVLAWGFYGHRLALYRRTAPHEGFQVLQRWGQAMRHGGWVFTSNVDGQFQRAGFDAQRIVECHGSIHHLQCIEPCRPVIWSADDFQPHVDEAVCRLINPAPRCPHCGALARPNVLMFGDGTWIDGRTGAQESRLADWLGRAERPVVVEVGAGTAVPSARHFSQQMVRHYRARLVRINPREAAVATAQDVGLAINALTGLKTIDALLGRPG